MIKFPDGVKAFLYVEKWSKTEYVGIKMIEPQKLEGTEVTPGVFIPLTEYDELRAEVGRVEERWENRSPTQWAYNQACKALASHKSRIVELVAKLERAAKIADESDCLCADLIRALKDG